MARVHIPRCMIRSFQSVRNKKPQSESLVTLRAIISLMGRSQVGFGKSPLNISVMPIKSIEPNLRTQPSFAETLGCAAAMEPLFAAIRQFPPETIPFATRSIKADVAIWSMGTL